MKILASRLTRPPSLADDVHVPVHPFMFMNDTSVKSAARVLDLLELFAVAPGPLGVSEVAKRLELPKSSAQALLLTLASRGYLTRGEAGYALPPELRVGWVGGIRTRLLGVARPVMDEMARSSGESAFIGMLTRDGRVRFLAKAVSPNEVRYDASLDHLRPAHSTSIGLVILAHLPAEEAERWLGSARLAAVTPHTVVDPRKLRQILRAGRKAGYVEVRDANVAGASGVSAPVFGPDGDVVAGLNLGAPSARYARRRDELVRIVCEQAARISGALRSTPRPRAAVSTTFPGEKQR
jgi:DNA-binding IclR family transcriptional regulator